MAAVLARADMTEAKRIALKERNARPRVVMPELTRADMTEAKRIALFERNKKFSLPEEAGCLRAGHVHHAGRDPCQDTGQDL